MLWSFLAEARASSIRRTCICSGASRWCLLICLSAPAETTGPGALFALRKKRAANRLDFSASHPLRKHGKRRACGHRHAQRRCGTGRRCAEDHRPALQSSHGRLPSSCGFLILTHPKFTAVESFFRDVVDPVVEEAGMTPH